MDDEAQAYWREWIREQEELWRVSAEHGVWYRAMLKWLKKRVEHRAIEDS